VSVAADALSIARGAAALALPWTLTHGSWEPLALVVAAAAADFSDGRLARRAGTATAHGAVLDNVADVTFVLAGTITGAALGRVPRMVPAAIAVAVAAYVIASVRRSADHAAPRLARSRLGHAAGVSNYAIVMLIAGSVALPGAIWDIVLPASSLVVVVINLAAVGARLLGAVTTPARAPRGAGT